MDFFKNHKHYGQILVRIVIALVFLWFGLNQLIDSQSWIGFLPGWAYNLPVSATQFVIINGILETVLGALLFLGLFTRLVSLILGLHLLGIALSVGYNDVGIRDLGLSLVTLSILFTGPDNKCLDNKIKESSFRNTFIGKILYIFD